MPPFVTFLYSIAIIGATVLAGAAIRLLIQRRETKRALLMLAVAAVTIGNVLIWTMPLAGS